MKKTIMMKFNIIAVLMLTISLFAAGAVAGILDNVSAEQKQDLKVTGLLEKADLLDYNMTIHQAQEILGDADVKLKFFPTEEKDTFIWEKKTSLFNKEYLLVLFEDYELHSIHYHDGKKVNLNYGSRRDAEDIIKHRYSFGHTYHSDAFPAVPALPAAAVASALPVPPVPGIPGMMDQSFFYYKMIDLKDEMEEVVKLLGAPSEITSGPQISYIWDFNGSKITVDVENDKVLNKRIKSNQFNHSIEIEEVLDKPNTTITNINLDKLK